MKKSLLLITFIALSLFTFAQTEKKSDLTSASIFPNPAVDYISLNNEESVKNIYVFNIAGRRLKTFDVVKGERYELNDLPNGIYFIQLIGRNNKLLTIQRLTKKA